LRRGSGTSVKSVRDKSTWVVTHGYTKAMLGNKKIEINKFLSYKPATMKKIKNLI
jgi:DNA-binding GntR family transcriptional regulator